MQAQLQQLQTKLAGELQFDALARTIYATDASVYRALPLAVAFPKSTADIQQLIAFARHYKTSLIPRAGGTSLAGQCVGEGIVVDCSKYLNKILEINAEESWVRVQPGVIRDELNHYLKPYGLFFGPNTSTANRCTLGGMLGNNSCGTSSIVYGTTRDHVLEVHTVLSDGSACIFKEITTAGFEEKCRSGGLEGQIYRQIAEQLHVPEQQAEIRAEYPKFSIKRRNTGYAVDLLLESNVFSDTPSNFDFCKLLAGSEGTLAFTTEIKLHVDPLPPTHEVVVAAHFSSLSDSMHAVLRAMTHRPYACELMDKIILDCTKGNIEQEKNRFFVEGDPATILMIELRAEQVVDAEALADRLIQDLQDHQLGYAYPKIFPPQTKNVWDLRKAGLGLLANIPGDAKAVACIEDTAVELQDLPAYVAEFDQIMAGFDQQAVYYAHAGAGELHLRPILDLKKTSDQQLFYAISEASARLVKKYQGSLSGEHGDGRVRAPFIPMMIGEKNYALLRSIKQTWDPNNILNPGKIVDAPPMNTSLRYEAEQSTPNFKTTFDFSSTQGILRAAEKCNGSGDCRKLSLSGGTMCPSYRATRNEKDSTRARANALREFLTRNAKDEQAFAHPELYEVMDLCLSCKGCTAECPSNVDMATLKAEFLHQYQQAKGIPLRARVFGQIGKLNQWAIRMPRLANAFLQGKHSSALLKRWLGVAPQRSLPPLSQQSLWQWTKQKHDQFQVTAPKRTVYFFCDEFTNYNDAEIGKKAILLLTRLGYQVRFIQHAHSGRAQISKGLLNTAKQLATANVKQFKDIITADTPLIGLEPSAILSFRDEYPRLVDAELRPAANDLAQHCLLIDEFLAQEATQGRITSAQFNTTPKHILLHGHCHQKALSEIQHTAYLLSLPPNYTVELIPSGCCGMAGSFGYEAEHYSVSMQIGELVLFPSIQEQPNAVIAATGTSCRHQIHDGTDRRAYHPVELLFEQLL